MSVGEWRLVAMVVAFAIGGLMSALRSSIKTIVGAGAAGLLMGGTWATLQAPNDIPVSTIDAFVSFVEVFWGQIFLLTAATAVGGFCCGRFVENDRPTPG
jgi:hypothetical protein